MEATIKGVTVEEAANGSFIGRFSADGMDVDLVVSSSTDKNSKTTRTMIKTVLRYEGIPEDEGAIAIRGERTIHTVITDKNPSSPTEAAFLKSLHAKQLLPAHACVLAGRVVGTNDPEASFDRVKRGLSAVSGGISYEVANITTQLDTAMPS